MSDHALNLFHAVRQRFTFRRFALIVPVVIVISGVLLWIMTVSARSPMPDSLTGLLKEVRKPQLTDRNGIPLTVTYANTWNSSTYIPLHDIPEFLKKAFILSEDRRFFDHNGVDWIARCHALMQNVLSLDTVRGASTISEQVVRMIHPRSRTLWSRWIEGFDAEDLESMHSKADILEFYLNQVPYAANRRGVSQASDYYFNRSLDTLNTLEQLALVVLIRAPSHLDLYRNPSTIRERVNRLALSLRDGHVLSDNDLSDVRSAAFHLEFPGLTVHAGHFAHYVFSYLDNEPSNFNRKIKTTMDGVLQNRIEHLTRQALSSLSAKKVANAACLVADHRTGRILAWVSVAADDGNASGRHIDGVLVPRQPGSSMKPFLYALALEKGWTAAEEIFDGSLTNPVGRGLHTYHNYSHRSYGWVTLRQALGNSLNIPAVKAIRFIGYERYLEQLHDLGFDHLDKHPDFYGDGLALGCGEVTLYHMVQAYGTLANRGKFRQLSIMDSDKKGDVRIFSEEAASLIGNILSDPGARNLEFGQGGLLSFPVQTAVKTGTSSDYRDAWAFGFNHGFVAGIWMGNFDGRPMDGITGSTGPAIVLRSVFAELNRHETTRQLYMNPRLERREVLVRRGFGKKRVPVNEWFIKGTRPSQPLNIAAKKAPGFVKPVNGLEMAMDPRIPDMDEAFEFLLAGVDDTDTIIWTMDGSKLAETRGGRYIWTLQKGKHVVEASIYRKGFSEPVHESVRFTVK